MRVEDFAFQLPEDLIAQHPLARRDDSRMLVLRRRSKSWEHCRFRDLPEILSADHFLVANSSRVRPARLWGARPGTEERIELLLLREESPGAWLCLTRPGRKTASGQILEVGSLRAQVVEIREDGKRLLQFEDSRRAREVLEQIGEPPLPPYIKRNPGDDFRQDSDRYQTIFAREPGSIAAPTAGLHFTQEILDRLSSRDIAVCRLLLHVGYGTFQPVRRGRVEDHRMEAEYFEVDPPAASCIGNRKARGGRLVAVGTTSTRVLEHLAHTEDGSIRPASGWCDLFIFPGFEFKVVDALLTNFHLPGSTLLMLVAAFAGRDLVLECYRDAVARRYRFYSYGDCMLIV